MNGPEHWAEAERLLTPDADGHVRSQHLERAAAHATLALVAAIADLDLNDVPTGDHDDPSVRGSLVDRDFSRTSAGHNTWAGVIRSTIGDPQ